MKRIFASQAIVITALALLLATKGVCTEDTPAAGSSTALSGTSAKRAKWQERLTLGPGDVLRIAMVDMPESIRGEVLIAPDGRINYMEVRNFMATGMTVDELRSALDKALGKFYRTPRTVVIPLAYNSKKYILLGAVSGTGVFPLNRPTTVIEAVARAGGLQSGVINNNPAELADLSHSFLVRDGKKLDVDFEKLFQRGDLSQNVPLEPNDFLYFPPATLNEIYVLGDVGGPGPQVWDRSTTMVSAITRAGSFRSSAYRQKVLVVRGSINNPKTFVVDTAAILSGKEPDFKLEPKDIVYVSSKPWQLPQDLLASAVAAFTSSAIITYSGNHIGPWITTPIIK